MSQEAFYYQVQMQEEYEMSKIKEFAQEMREEFLASEQEYCVYCGEEKSEKYDCCGENHYASFADLGEDVQTAILDAEIKQYEKATK